MKLFLNPVFWCFDVWRFSMISCEFSTNISWEMSIVCCCVNWPSVIIHRNFITFKQFSCNQWVNFHLLNCNTEQTKRSVHSAFYDSDGVHFHLSCVLCSDRNAIAFQLYKGFFICCSPVCSYLLIYPYSAYEAGAENFKINVF